MTVHVLSLSSSRADTGILLPVWHALAAADCRLSIYLTGMHCAADAPSVEGIPSIAQTYRGGVDLGGAGPAEAARAMAAMAADLAGICERLGPDIALAMGDRLDMLAPALALLPFNLPVAHLHGGELTYGAVDERARHALTKMAHLHFVSHVEAARRLVHMGEEPWRVHVTGGPGLDRLSAAPVLGPEEFAAAIGAPIESGFALVTAHPETNAGDPAAPMRAIMAALERLAMPCLITAPNSDPGGAAMGRALRDFAARHPRAVYRVSLGPTLYASAIRLAGLVLGNSSSGLIEAGFLGTPAVDVGGRQDGRPHGPGVERVPASVDAVVAAIRRVAGRRTVRYSPYGDGRAAPRIARQLAALPPRERLLYKRFHDGPAPEFSAPWPEAGPAVG